MATPEQTPTHKHEGGLSVRDQIERYRTAFIAVVTMIVIAAGSAGYILAHERLSVPAWVPVLGRESFKLNGEFETGQAVTPGQGQSVDIAGIQIGKVTSVDLEDGHAVVGMDIVPKYMELIHPNATFLLRPLPTPMLHPGLEAEMSAATNSRRRFRRCLQPSACSFCCATLKATRLQPSVSCSTSPKPK